MSKVRFTIQVNTRAYLWLKQLAERGGLTLNGLINTVLLKALEQNPKVDLSKCPPTQEEGETWQEMQKSSGPSLLPKKKACSQARFRLKA